MAKFNLNDRVIIIFNHTSLIDLTEFGKSLIGKYGKIVKKKNDGSGVYWQVFIEDILEKHYFCEEDLSIPENLCRIESKIT